MQMVPVPMNQPMMGPMLPGTLPPGTQAVMVPNPMYRQYMLHRHKKWCKKQKKKKKKKKEESDSSSESEEESEYYYVGKPKQPQPQQPSQAGRKYEIFAPSHPQAVNQFIRDYNYSIEPKQDKNKDLYDKAVAQYHADLEDELYAMEDEYYGYEDDPYGDPYGDFYDDPYGGDPYDDYGGGYNGY